MLNQPEAIATIKAKAVPVSLNVTGRGLPEDVPALSLWAENYHRNPWTRMINAFFAVMDPDGVHLYGSLSCQCVELMDLRHPYIHGMRDLRRFLDNFEQVRALEARVAEGDAEAGRKLASLRRDIREQVRRSHICSKDIRLHTARALLDYGALPWEDVLEALRPRREGERENLEPGVRNLAIHALGEFVTDLSPFAPETEAHVRAIFARAYASRMDAILARLKRSGADLSAIRITDMPMPVSLRRRAAAALAVIAGAPLDPDDPELLGKAARWWGEHEDDEAFAYRGR